MAPSLYIHIPLCRSKCDYCDFFSIPSGKTGNPELQKLLVRAINQEKNIRMEQFSISSWDTVYIGGGTPSLLTVEALSALTDGLIGPAREATIEANPQDLNQAWLESCAAAGFSRLSLGIQSMNDLQLTSAGRRGTRAGNLSGLACAARYWRGDLSVDLISGLPDQSQEGLENDINEVLQYPCDHISLYALTLEDGTVLAERLKENNRSVEETGERLWIAGRDQLEKKGFRQYEVSNFSRPGKESLHNSAYWEMRSWIGLGPGASGTIIQGDRGTRFTNCTDIERYLSAPAGSGTIEELDRKTLIIESIMMGFRMNRGISRISFQNRFGVDILDCIGTTVQRWQKRNLIALNPERIALSGEGLLFLNRFVEECMEEI